MEKYYKISEKELIELLASSIRMATLDRGGVNNWCGYGENFEETIKQYGSKCETFYDCAKILVTDYPEVEG